MLHSDKNNNFSLHGKSIRTKCVVYAGRQKHQKSNFTKIPTGTIGTIRVCELDIEYGIEVFLVRFMIGNQSYFSKLSHSVFEITECSIGY